MHNIKCRHVELFFTCAINATPNRASLVSGLFDANDILVRTFAVFNTAPAPVETNHRELVSIFAMKLEDQKTLDEGSSVNETCPVCLCDMHINRITHLSCAHRFHTECLLEMAKFSTRCPTCRCEIE